jgi:hypothetical protein
MRPTQLINTELTQFCVIFAVLFAVLFSVLFAIFCLA